MNRAIYKRYFISLSIAVFCLMSATDLRAELSIDKTQVAFPAQKPGLLSAPEVITVSNLDAANSVTLGAVSFSGPNAGDFALTPGANSCPWGELLAAGSACSFSVNFVGSGPDGTKTATATILATAPSGTILSGVVALSGATDSTPPAVTYTMATDLAVHMPANYPVTVTFSEPVTNISTATFLLSTARVPVLGDVTFDETNNTAVFKPSTNLLADTAYTAVITTAVTDLAGNHLAQDHTFGFITAAADRVPPKVVATTPAPQAARVRTGTTTVTATFDKPVYPSSVNGTTFTLGEGITGTVTYDPRTNTATLTTEKPLASDQTYTATITTGLMSLGSVSIQADYTWTFVTNATPTAMRLYSPKDSELVTGPTVSLQWIRAADADAEIMIYEVYSCTSPTMNGCNPVMVISSETPTVAFAGVIPQSTSPIARSDGYGLGMLLAGFAMAGGVRSRKKIILIFAALLISGMTVVSCGKKSSEEPQAPPTPGLLSSNIASLQPATTYYWKVVADDGNGGIVSSETWSFTTK